MPIATAPHSVTAILTHVMQARASVSIRYAVPAKPDAWVIPEGPVPEATAHDAAVLRVYLLLRAWAEARGDCRVARNLALRWLEQHPRTGIDPDVCVLSPAPEDFDDLTSLRLWEPGRTPPPFCVEVVSSSHPYKDYLEIHERYAALGTFELLVFDPLLFGPKALGGPVLLQLWRRDPTGESIRVSVQDTGIGIAQDDLARLARPFEQVESQHSKTTQGTGLGLALTKSLVEMHGGMLDMQSAPGEGTMVSFTIPLRQGDVAQPLSGFAAA